MKKVSIIALLSFIVFPSFAQDVTVSDAVSDQTVSDSFSEEEKALSEQDVKQEYVDVKEVAESEKSWLHGVQIGAGVSASSGLNGFVGYVNKDFDSFWAKRFGVRFDFATTKPVKSLIGDAVDSVMDDGIDIGDDLTIDGVDIDAKHFAALVDFYPFGDTWMLGGWRITGGYAFGDMNISANIAGVVDALDATRYEFELAGQSYAYVGNSVHGTACLDWKYRGPYLGTGFDIGLFAGLKIYVDAGVVFTNRAAQLSLDVPFENLQKLEGGVWKPVDSEQLQAEVDKYKGEVLADAQSALDDFKFYPMVKMGFLYRF